jgi:hypothetical protein
MKNTNTKLSTKAAAAIIWKIQNVLTLCHKNIPENSHVQDQQEYCRVIDVIRV